MRAYHYARALEDLIKEDPKNEEQIMRHFFETIEKNGHEYLLRKVLRSFIRLNQRAVKLSTIEVVTAEPIADTEVQKILKQSPFNKILTTSHKRVARTVDDTLIGGIIVRTGSERVDNSYKRALTELYQHITN